MNISTDLIAEKKAVHSTSSLRLAARSAKLSFSTALDVIQEAWPVLIVLQMVSSAGDQFFSYGMDQVRASGREDIIVIASLAGLEMIFTLVWSAFWIIVICAAASSKDHNAENEWLRPSLLSRLNQLMIEQIRVLASVIWRMPLLLVPAAVQFVRMAFVPFVVLLDPRYEQDKIDALEESRRLSRGHFWLLGVTILIAGVIPWIPEQLLRSGGGFSFSENPLRYFLSWILKLVFHLISSVFLLELYRGTGFFLSKQRVKDSEGVFK